MYPHPFNQSLDMSTAQIDAINPSNVILGSLIANADTKRTAVQEVYAASDTNTGSEIGIVYQTVATGKWVTVVGKGKGTLRLGSAATKAEAVALFEPLATRMGLDLLNDKMLVTLFNLLRTPALGGAGNPQLPLVWSLLFERGFESLLTEAVAANSNLVLQ